MFFPIGFQRPASMLPAISSLVLAQPGSGVKAPQPAARVSIRPQALLDVVRRRGHSLGLLAQYEEARLLKR